MYSAQELDTSFGMYSRHELHTELQDSFKSNVNYSQADGSAMPSNDFHFPTMPAKTTSGFNLDLSNDVYNLLNSLNDISTITDGAGDSVDGSQAYIPANTVEELTPPPTDVNLQHYTSFPAENTVHMSRTFIEQYVIPQTPVKGQVAPEIPISTPTTAFDATQPCNVSQSIIPSSTRVIEPILPITTPTRPQLTPNLLPPTPPSPTPFEVHLTPTSTQSRQITPPPNGPQRTSKRTRKLTPYTKTRIHLTAPIKEKKHLLPSPTTPKDAETPNLTEEEKLKVLRKREKEKISQRKCRMRKAMADEALEASAEAADAEWRNAWKWIRYLMGLCRENGVRIPVEIEGWRSKRTDLDDLEWDLL